MIVLLKLINISDQLKLMFKVGGAWLAIYLLLKAQLELLVDLFLDWLI